MVLVVSASTRHRLVGRFAESSNFGSSIVVGRPIFLVVVAFEEAPPIVVIAEAAILRNLESIL
jgi:hypothetical protein